MIHFRSRYGSEHAMGNALQKTILHGDDWSHLSAYTSDIDARDIVWMRSTDTNIVTRRRDTERSIQILVITHDEFADDFASDYVPSRHDWKKSSIDRCAHSATRSGYAFRIVRTTDWQRELFLQKIKNHLILCFLRPDITSDLFEKLKPMMHMNDVICIAPYHPMELDPSDSLFIEGKIFDRARLTDYQIELQKMQKSQKKQFEKHGAHILFPSTAEDIERFLNSFFKHRYA